jgi:hypothetical protein
MDIVLRIPYKQVPILGPLVNGLYFSPGDDWTLVPSRYKRWVHIVNPLTEKAPLYRHLQFDPPDYILTDSVYNYSFLIEMKFKHPQIIGLWKGGRSNLSAMNVIFGGIALDWNYRYSKHWSHLDEQNPYHFFEIKTMEELGKRNPLSIISSDFIGAILMGDDWRYKERRPKHIPYYNLETKMKDSQISLTKECIEYMKEVMGRWPRTS